MEYIGLPRPSYPLAATLERIVKVSCNCKKKRVTRAVQL